MWQAFKQYDRVESRVDDRHTAEKEAGWLTGLKVKHFLVGKKRPSPSQSTITADRWRDGDGDQEVQATVSSYLDAIDRVGGGG